MHTGSSRSAVYLAYELKKIGFDVTVLIPKGQRNLSILEDLGIKYRLIRYYNWTRKINEPWYMKITRAIRQFFRFVYNHSIGYEEIKRLFVEEKFDLIALNNTWVYLPAHIAYKCHIPFVWHLREFNEEDHGWTFCNKKKSYALMAKSDALIGVSEAICNKYQHLIAPKDLYKVLNGVDPDAFLPINRVPLSMKKMRLGIIGRISSSKGQIDLIKALSLVKKKCEPFVVYIAGSGAREDEKRLQASIREFNMTENVVLLGEIDNLTNFYRSVDVLVVCSKMEAFGRVAVEGMLAQCIVVASNTGGLMEVIEDRETGYLFNQGDAQSLSQTIISIIENKQKAQSIAQNGRRNALRYFSSEKNANKIARIYLNILQKNEGENQLP